MDQRLDERRLDFLLDANYIFGVAAYVSFK